MSSSTDPRRDCTPCTERSRCELECNLDILRGVPIFSGIPLERLRIYAYVSGRVCYRAGEFLFRQGDSDDRGYIVINGQVQVVRELQDHSVLLNEFKPGDFFGGLALLSDIKRLFSARAVTYLECLSLDRESFRKLLVQFPEVGVKVLDMMIKRVVEMEEKLLSSQVQECLYG